MSAPTCGPPRRGARSWSGRAGTPGLTRRCSCRGHFGLRRAAPTGDTRIPQPRLGTMPKSPYERLRFRCQGPAVLLLGADLEERKEASSVVERTAKVKVVRPNPWALARAGRRVTADRHALAPDVIHRTFPSLDAAISLEGTSFLLTFLCSADFGPLGSVKADARERVAVFCNSLLERGSPEAIRARIPEITFEAQAGENRAHLLRRRAPRMLLQARCIPCAREGPELVHSNEWLHLVTIRRAPLTNPFFRPEEEHVASREHNIVPPLGRRNQAVEEPRGGPRTLEAYLEMKRLPGLLAPGVHLTRLL